MTRGNLRPPAPALWHLPPSSAVPAHASAGERIQRLLAESHPEPMERADLVRRLSLRPMAVSMAMVMLLQHGLVRRERLMVGRKGYAYTVTT
jgi:predicted DNA-binding transcriptional regulator